jgi:F-box-like
MTIDVLPDVVLLEMFDYYANQVREEDSPDVTVESWRRLVHVCRNWRSVVSGSPRRLNLRLLCAPETPVRKTLAVWPYLPIFIQQRQYGLPGGGDSDNIVAALEHNDRVCEIDLFDFVGKMMVM